MSRKATTHAVEHRVTTGDFERKMIKRYFDSEADLNRQKMIENYANMGLKYTTIGVGIYAGYKVIEFLGKCLATLSDTFGAITEAPPSELLSSVMQGAGFVQKPVQTYDAAGNKTTDEEFEKLSALDRIRRGLSTVWPFSGIPGVYDPLENEENLEPGSTSSRAKWWEFWE